MPSSEPFGVYVHWPFCKAKCPYCDFNSHVRHGGVDEARFLAGYLTELRHFARRAPGEMPKLGQIAGEKARLVHAAVAHMGIEVAIGALGLAERPMHIDPE